MLCMQAENQERVKRVPLLRTEPTHRVTCDPFGSSQCHSGSARPYTVFHSKPHDTSSDQIVVGQSEKGKEWHLAHALHQQHASIAASKLLDSPRAVGNTDIVKSVDAKLRANSQNAEQKPDFEDNRQSEQTAEESLEDQDSASTVKSFRTEIFSMNSAPDTRMEALMRDLQEQVALTNEHLHQSALHTKTSA
jgi:hypothetical protein